MFNPTNTVTPAREATIGELVEGIMEMYGPMSGQLLNAELAYYFEAPQLARVSPTDVQVGDFFYVSVETWQRWDMEIKKYFGFKTWSGLGKHPSLI